MTNAEYIKFLEEQGEGYVWQFVKQETDFDKIFLSAKLFNEWKQNPRDLSSENFFITQHSKYGITNRHRTLIIAQLYGLITKNSSQYAKEDLTPVFNELNYCTDVNAYKCLVSEQLLKIKLPAITYSRSSDANSTRHIFPIIFIYQVLKRLKQLNILSITVAELYTYVMTANFHTDLERVITSLTQPVKPIVKISLLRLYKDRSRIVPLLKNLSLFNVNNDIISINPAYESKMDEFLRIGAPQFMRTELTNPAIYKNFLYNSYNFGINLVDEDVDIIIAESNDDIRDDAEYTEDVVTQIAPYRSEYELESLSKQAPNIVSEGERLVVKRDSSIGVFAITKSDYKCEYDNTHSTFISKRTKKAYMEAHHLIPVSQSQYIWDRKKANIDCIENIVSLCPNCHRAIHHGELDTKLNILKKLHDARRSDLSKVGLNIDFETLLKFYL